MLPPSQLGLIKLGEKADVKIDSYPDKIFKGTIKEISQTAEFTPRQSITQRERANLVFAVEVKLENKDGILKPGMPADVVFKMIISLKNVSKKFKNLIAVDNINLDINEGEIFGIVGPDGAGKTTTIRLILELLVKDSGTIEVMGQKKIEELKPLYRVYSPKV